MRIDKQRKIRNQVVVLGLFFTVWQAGCGATRVTLTQRSSIEQQLLVRSLERAAAQLDARRFRGRRVALDLFALTRDVDFTKEYLAVWLEEQGVRVVKDPDKAELRLKVFAWALGVDRGDTLVGVPAFVAPIMGIPVPEVALFKSVKHQGHVEIQIYTFDGPTGEFKEKSAVGTGQASYEEYTILIVISFTLSDINSEAPPSSSLPPARD